MADENATPTPAATTTATEPRVPKWGDPISSIPTERQEQLQKLAEEQRAWVAATGPDRDPKQSPFARATGFGRSLTGVEVFFLATQAYASEKGIALDEAEQRVRNRTELERSEGPDGFDTPGGSEAIRDVLAAVQDVLSSMDVLGTLHLEGADLSSAYLKNAILGGAHLEGANLYCSHLEGTDLFRTHLERAYLAAAHLEGANLFYARLQGADLRGAFFSTATDMMNAAIADEVRGAAWMADVRWQDVNLAVVQQWSAIAMLGDEREARRLVREPLRNPYRPSLVAESLHREASPGLRYMTLEGRRVQLLGAWRDAARANRQLASVMRDQGMNDEADRFAYRGQVCQRQVYRYSGQRGRRLGSWLLDATSGYGYHPRRSAFTYIGVVLVFAVAFFLFRASVSPTLTPLDALVFSVTSFHGRGFSPGEAVTLHNPLTVLAAGEAILGLLIEITFIATFTQRFFGR